MIKFTPRWAFVALLAFAAIARVNAQELSLLGGAMSTRNVRFSTYSWQLDYRQDLTRYFAGSVALINEGHIAGHHRDGTAFEGWLRLPLFHDRFSLSAGAGAYYYYDTQPRPGGDSADVHGTAAIYSVSAVAYLSDRWFLKATVNRIEPRSDVKTNTAALGVGFWFGRNRRPTKGELGAAPADDHYVTGNEITAYGGQSIVNTLFSESARAWAVEYRRGILPHVDWTVTAINEGNPHIVQRNGVATQAWLVNTFFKRQVSVGIGLGPYIYIDRRHPVGLTRWSPAAASPLVSLTGSYRFARHWLVRILFNRVTTNYNRDSDVILVGLGYHWGDGPQ